MGEANKEIVNKWGYDIIVRNKVAGKSVFCRNTLRKEESICSQSK